MVFEDTISDPDVWRREANKADGTSYYELLLLYVDDILVVGHEPDKTIKAIGDIYKIKEESDGPLTTYLGAKVYKHNLPNGRSVWFMSSEKYVQKSVRTVKYLL